MALSLEDAQFLEQMVLQLEETIAELVVRERQISDSLGEERVSELAALWHKQLDHDEELELRRTMDWTDRELIWIWARLQRARSARAEAGKAIMTRFDATGDAPDDS
ncbi:MAG: hypothetical protein U1E83_04860 [Methylotetracoccus sp.]